MKNVAKCDKQVLQVDLVWFWQKPVVLHSEDCTFALPAEGLQRDFRVGFKLATLRTLGKQGLFVTEAS